jgi:hypothetical protein
MRLPVSLLLAAGWLGAQHYEAPKGEIGWKRVLEAHGLIPAQKGLPQVLVSGSEADAGLLEARAADGAVVILRGHSAAAVRLGVELTAGKTEVRQTRDLTRSELPLVWEKAEVIAVAKLSAEWTVYAKERWTGAPVLAGRKLGAGAALWTATEIGERGYERYPYLPQALRRLGVESPARARNLTAFFDASHRLRADIPFLVRRWREAGLSAVHVTSWQFDGAAAEKAEWLARLIRECHAEGIAVYAWVELPHVSDGFWERHPECREKTASGTEAALDWRKLINLVNPRCSTLAEEAILGLLRSYDWDGVNLGELYFESLEGWENPSRFTPYSKDALAYFRRKTGTEPADKPGAMLAARADLAAELQAHWLERLETLRQERPEFDIVLTHIDDRLDTRMREALGADSAGLLAATEGRDVQFLVEDPATVWHLGPERYAAIRKAYDGLTQEPRRLAIDLNIVERYQDVYPTKQQTGGELAQLVHEAARNFAGVALYFEASLAKEDLPLLGGAAGRLQSWQEAGKELVVELDGASWLKGGAWRWPLGNEEEVLLPAGRHRLVRGDTGVRVEPRGLEIESVRESGGGWDIVYTARTRGWLFSLEAFRVEGVGEAKPDGRGRWVLEMGRGVGRKFRLEARPTPQPETAPSTERN